MSRELQRLNSQHQRILELFLEGLTVTQIATEMSLLPNSVSRITQAPLFQDAVSRRRREMQQSSDDAMTIALGRARSALATGAERAVAKLTDLLDAGNEGIALRSAQTLLEHAFEGVGGKGSGSTGPAVALQINLGALQSALREADGLPPGEPREVFATLEALPSDAQDAVEGPCCGEGGVAVEAPPTGGMAAPATASSVGDTTGGAA